MYTVFKFVMYLGVVASLAGVAMPYFADHPLVQALPGYTKTALPFVGLGLIVLGLIGRTATRKEPDEAEWK